MKNFFSLIILAFALVVTSCGSDDNATPSIDFPTTVTFQSITNVEDIMIFRNDNGVVTEISADDTMIDDTDDVNPDNIEASIDEITFIDETMAEYITFGQPTSLTYTVEGDDLRFVFAPGIAAIGKGVPTDFEIESQLVIVESNSGGYSSAGAVRFPISSLKEDLEDGDVMLVMNYTERLAQ